MSYAAIAVGVGTIAYGAISKGKAKRRMRKLQAERKEYETPDEVYKMLQATQQNAQTGLGSQVLGYLTGSADRALSSGVGTIQQMGGDLNDLSGLFEQKMQQDMRIGAQNQAAQLANFSKYLVALNTVGENRSAEWQSGQNMLKDDIQAQAAFAADGQRTINSGINSAMTGVGMYAAGKLYGDNNNPNYLGPALERNDYVPPSTVSTSSGPSTPQVQAAPKNPYAK